MHCKLLKGSTSIQVFDALFQEVGIRWLACVCSRSLSPYANVNIGIMRRATKGYGKNMSSASSSLPISLNDVFQVIVDLKRTMRSSRRSRYVSLLSHCRSRASESVGRFSSHMQSMQHHCGFRAAQDACLSPPSQGCTVHRAGGRHVVSAHAAWQPRVRKLIGSQRLQLVHPPLLSSCSSYIHQFHL
ncbi:hypothetical protein OG21DRAFT_437742 [Imleria badia]|nr:hypothetical protein OG21DRAFT_437742 [Imleria badia]